MTLQAKNVSLPALLAIPVLLVALACANPADDKPAAVVEEPAPASDPAPADDAEMAESSVYTFDSETSEVSFVGSKVTGSHDGGFEVFAGSVSVPGDDLSSAHFSVDIDATSVWSDDDRLTGHLQSPDFFDVENHPEASFHSTAIAAGAEGASHTVTGDLTLRGVTKSISFPADIAMADGGVDASAEFSINRMDFDIAYAGRADDLIREEVVIKLDIKARADGMDDGDGMDEGDGTDTGDGTEAEAG